MGEVRFTCGERLILHRCPKTGQFHQCIKTVTMSEAKYKKKLELPVKDRKWTVKCKKHKCKCGLEFK